MSLRNLKKDLPAYLFLLICQSILFWPVLFQGALLAGGDVNYQYSIWTQFFVDWVRQGVFPFWNPYAFCGTPFLHDMQTATLYPPGWIHFFLPIPWSFGFSAYLHTFFAGCGFYVLSQRWLERRLARTLSALLFMSGAFITSRLLVGEPTVTQAYAWMPLFFHAGLGVAEAPSVRRIALFAWICAMVFLSGHPHLPFLLLHLFAALVVIQQIRSIGHDGGIKRILSGWGALIAGGLLALLIVLPQAGPFLEFAGHSATRAGGAAYKFAAEGSLEPHFMLLQIMPLFFGDPGDKSFWVTTAPYMELTAYMGTFGMLLILSSIFLNRKPLFWLWMISLALAGVLALGEHTPLHWLFYKFMPGWDHFRNPGRSLVISTFSGCVLAGYGLEGLLSRKDPAQLRRLIATLLILSITIAFTGFILLTQRERILNIMARDVSIAASQFMGTASEYQPEQFTDRFGWMVFSVFLLSGGCLGYLLFLAGFYVRPHWWKPLGFLLVIACAMDLLWFGGRFLQALTREEWKKKYFPDSEVMQTLHAEPEPGRLLVVDSGLDWRVQPLHPELFPNTPMRYGVRTVRGYSPSILKSFSEFINLIQGWPAEALPGGFLFLGDIKKMDPMALNVMGVRSFLDYFQAPAPFVPVKRFPTGLILYRNPEGLPRCFRARTSAGTWGYEPVKDPLTSARVTEINPNRIEAETEGIGEDLLVFSDNSFPGWTATVNGTILKPMKVFHTFMAVPVPAGKSHVVWEFRPSHWSLYLLLSAAGIGLSLILSAIPVIRKQARQG